MAKIRLAPSKSRKFNGKRYALGVATDSKREAQKEAKKHRDAGRYARVIYEKPYWCMYFRR